MIKSQKDFFAGLLFMAVGLAFAIGAMQYTLGVAANMGPGYFPLILGIVQIVLGAVVVFQSLTRSTPDGGKIGPWAFRPLFFVILANLLFGIFLGGLPSIGLPSMGLVVAIFALTIVASLAGGAIRWREVLMLAAVLSTGCYLAFVLLLKLQFPVWPAFIGL